MYDLNRAERAILVPAAHSTASIACIRSFGRAGYEVHAVAASANALGLQSKYARHAAVHPLANSPDFDKWFRDYIRRHNIAMIVPGGGMSPASAPVFAEHAHLFPVSTDPAVLDAGASKHNLVERLVTGTGKAAANLGPHMLVDLTAELPGEAELAALGAPLFVKLDSYHAHGGEADQVVRCSNAAAARLVLAGAANRYDKAFVQGFVPGKGVGVFLLRWKGEVRASFMHQRVHEMPHTGGASSLRRSWRHEAMLSDAIAKFEHLDWEGVGMVEYRWASETDEFVLMEMNLRFWGSLHLALHAGVDFPRLLADAFFVGPEAPLEDWQLNLLCRNTIPFEVGYLVSLWRDVNVDVWRKLHSIFEAVALSLDPRVKNDLIYPGDSTLFLIRALQFIGFGGLARLMCREPQGASLVVDDSRATA